MPAPRTLKPGEQVRWSRSYLERIGSRSPEIRHATGILIGVTDRTIYKVGMVDWMDGGEPSRIRLDHLIHA